MPQVDVVQETFVAATPDRVAAHLARPAVPAALWPGLTVTVSEDRGRQGQRYSVDGPWHGSAELWLEPCLDGVLVHAYLRIDAVRKAGPARARRVMRRRDTGMRRALWVCKDELEAGRAVGASAVGAVAGAGRAGAR